MLLEQQEACEVPFSVEEPADEADHRRNLIAGCGRLRLRAIELLCKARVIIGVEPSYQPVLIGVVPIEGADCDAGRFGDHRHRRRIRPALGEQMQRGSIDAGFESGLSCMTHE
jgi:hypothetical protein